MTLYKMVLKINYFREKAEELRESQKKRFKNPNVIDLILELDDVLKSIRTQSCEIRRILKLNQVEIVRLKKNKENNDYLINQCIELREKLQMLMTNEKNAEQELNNLIKTVGNIIDKSVPISNDEKDNLIIATYQSNNPILPSPLPHHKLLEKIGGFNQKRGSKVIGHRGYFLTNIGVRLNMALQQYALDFLEERGYSPIQPPFMLNSEVMEKTAELNDFQETLYQIDSQSFLIATSEQPLTAYHMNEVINKKDLPLKYAGISTCFRKEAGAHGKETWGLFRVHQFEKVEQIIICDPDTSNKWHQKMLDICQEFYQSLGLSYRVVSIVSGALNNAASKKYDLEAWFPSYGEYKELVSCSNCTDYQSHDLNIKIDANRGYVHILNGTLCASQRTICCLLENHQRENGIEIPLVLQKYLKGWKFIPFSS